MIEFVRMFGFLMRRWRSKNKTMNSRLIDAALGLRDELRELHFATPVSHVYRPLDYAWAPHEDYLRRYGTGQKKVVFLGMNPGPFGMAQTGVPFGEVSFVRDWMGIDCMVGKPECEHPKRPIEGFNCTRSEVSGRRLWGLFAERFGLASTFFDEHFVVNYCPLVFMSDTGTNITPDKLPTLEKKPMEQACDLHLGKVLDALQPDWAIGVGEFAKERLTRARDACGARHLKVGRILHPSPASPAANRGWGVAATRQLVEQGVWAESSQ